MPRRKPPRPKHSKTRKDAVKAGFRSGFEHAVAGQLLDAGCEFEYEPYSITYPAPDRRYKPDFVLPNGIILEVKGRFTGPDRAKHLRIKKAHPDLDIRFVFQVDNKLTKVSKTRYSDWCEKNGFPYCFVTIPEEWLQEV